MKIENQFLFYLMTATQYQEINEFSRAETYYEKALRLNSNFPNLIKTYASFLLSRKKYDKMLSIIENLKGQDKEAFHYHAFKGRALYYKQRYNAAIDALLEANKIYDSDISVLNTLGFSLIRIGQKEDAVNALVASLKINNDQKDILKILDQLQNNKKREKNDKSE
jgi:tetratricopeptide (TPR) repeat protein